MSEQRVPAGSPGGSPGAAAWALAVGCLLAAAIAGGEETSVSAPAAGSPTPAESKPADLPSAAGADQAYRVGPADVFQVEVYDNHDLTGTYTVAVDGAIAYPLLGKVQVGGLTVEEVKQLLTNLLKKDYLYDPIVSVTIKDYRSRQVTVLGDVGRPGVFYLDRPTRLMDVLSRAEGISPQVGKVVRGQTARIARRMERPAEEGAAAHPRIVAVDLYQLLIEGNDEANLPLQDGDVIYVERTPSVHVIGEVKKPGSFPFEAGMSVLKAITIAGGTTAKGSAKGAVVKRIQDGKEVKVKVRMETLLEPEDIIEIPLSFW